MSTSTSVLVKTENTFISYPDTVM